jgi:hypothetical protein
MKRLVMLGLAIGLGALLSGCAMQAEDEYTEQTDDQSEELHESTSGVPQQGGDPRDDGLARSGDTSGPSPYPWVPENCDDPNEGPSPYPWKASGADQGAGTGTGTGTDDDTGDTSQKKTSGP